jgi:hypothetical protein
MFEIKGLFFFMRQGHTGNSFLRAFRALKNAL